MEINSRHFVRCSNCGRANDLSSTTCKQCGSAMQIPSAEEHGRERHFPKILLVMIPLAVIVIPVFITGYFVYSGINSYGQIALEVVDAPPITGSPENSQIKPTKNWWFNQSWKSWIYETPTVRDIILKDIESSGGWEAMRNREAIEIKGELYETSCETLDAADTYGNITVREPNRVTLQVKDPNKYYLKVESPYGYTLGTQHYNGKDMFACTVSNIKWSCEQGEPEPAMTSRFMSGMANYSREYVLYNRVTTEKLRTRAVYTIPATEKQLSKDEFDARRKLKFDTITGRLIAVELPNGDFMEFQDFKNVDSVSMPHRFCYKLSGKPVVFVVTSWNFKPEIDDSIFERPDKD